MIIAIAAVLLGGAAFSAASASAAAIARPHRSHSQPEHARRHHVKRRAKPKAAKRPRPQWALGIPGIGVSARLLSFGAHHGGDLPVPALVRAGNPAWYKFTAVPGARGNAVIVGHVDTYTGPGVFYDLYLLVPGDLVYVTTGSRRAIFRVTSVTEVPKPDFPVNKVFGPTRSRRLWLITCGGDFDYTTRHYLDNIIVSANYERRAGSLR
ncbi:MAG: class F sortase [Trebonia sp.]